MRRLDVGAAFLISGDRTSRLCSAIGVSRLPGSLSPRMIHVECQPFSPLQSGDSSRTDVAREARRDRRHRARHHCSVPLDRGMALCRPPHTDTDDRHVRGRERPAPWLPAQPCQGRLPRRLVREQRCRRASFDSVGVQAGTSARVRPLRAGGRHADDARWACDGAARCGEPA